MTSRLAKTADAKGNQGSRKASRAGADGTRSVPATFRRLLLVALPVGAGLTAAWWIDPRQVHVPLCTFHELTGLHCPGCGATRATHELLHGRIGAALTDNALWVLASPLAVYLGISEMVRQVRGRPLPTRLLRAPWLLIAAAVVAVLFGVLRNVPVVPLTWLAPPG